MGYRKAVVQNFAKEETEESLNNDQWTGSRKPFSVGLQVAQEDAVGKSKDDSISLFYLLRLAD